MLPFEVFLKVVLYNLGYPFGYFGPPCPSSVLYLPPVYPNLLALGEVEEAALLLCLVAVLLKYRHNIGVISKLF